MRVVVPSVSWAVVLQGAAFTTFVELPSGPTQIHIGHGATDRLIWGIGSISTDLTLG
jgi:hypothetical protein